MYRIACSKFKAQYSAASNSNIYDYTFVPSVISPHLIYTAFLSLATLPYPFRPSLRPSTTFLLYSILLIPSYLSPITSHLITSHQVWSGAGTPPPPPHIRVTSKCSNKPSQSCASTSSSPTTPVVIKYPPSLFFPPYFPPSPPPSIPFNTTSTPSHSAPFLRSLYRRIESRVQDPRFIPQGCECSLLLCECGASPPLLIHSAENECRVRVQTTGTGTGSPSFHLVHLFYPLLLFSPHLTSPCIAVSPSSTSASIP